VFSEDYHADKTVMTEILFEAYNAPSVTYGIDCLFSHYYNSNGSPKSSLVVSSSNSATHVVPVINGKGMLAHATRLNWGRSHSVDYLQKLLQLKYPTFPGKWTPKQFEAMVSEHCYTSQNYVAEMGSFLDWTGLESRDIVVQFPYTEQVVVEKTEEELARAAERREENTRRLREQAAKSRLEKVYCLFLDAVLINLAQKEGRRARILSRCSDARR
jgi:actin-related protein 5